MNADDTDAEEKDARRDWFAAVALQGILARTGEDGENRPRNAAAWAYDFAEAMEAERAKRIAAEAARPRS